MKGFPFPSKRRTSARARPTELPPPSSNGVHAKTGNNIPRALFKLGPVQELKNELQNAKRVSEFDALNIAAKLYLQYGEKPPKEILSK